LELERNGETRSLGTRFAEVEGSEVRVGEAQKPAPASPPEDDWGRHIFLILFKKKRKSGPGERDFPQTAGGRTGQKKRKTACAESLPPVRREDNTTQNWGGGKW